MPTKKAKAKGKGKKEGAKKKKKQQAEGVKKKLPIKLMAFALVPLLLGGGGFVAWKKLIKKPPAEEQEQEVEEEEKVPLSYLPLEPFVVNLKGSGRRFLKVSITLALEGAKGAELAQKEVPPIRNAILLLLTNKRFEEVTTLEGKRKLQEEILAKVNDIIEGTQVREVYFTKFIAQ